ncbi:fasciclin domain-containing protein [Fibrella aquatilis]|uniref:Fasciclin domain-containing protein n=1 Tax=Fibrella aquatilis TaxID=2817059 RepID=A0A939G7T6_9BACT|nr:fasciclin domain-containing protein [Fibrella aquatilis]MBO0934017.1 fasciclin domain-containing protein [Fibrella aquatilis]
MKKLLNIVALSAITLVAGSALAQTNTMNRPTPVGSTPSTTMSDSANRPTQSGMSSKSTGTDLAGSLASATDFSTLQTALQAAGLSSNAKEAGPFTVFAPSNAAFDKLPAGTVQTLTQPANKAKLANILAYHVVSGNVMAADLKDGQKIKTVSGGTLTVRKQGSAVMLVDAKGGSATVTTADIQATNGTVHAIDSVLMPK